MTLLADILSKYQLAAPREVVEKAHEGAAPLSLLTLLGVFLYERLCEQETHTFEEAKLRYDMIDQWYTRGLPLLDSIDEFESSGITVPGSERFRECMKSGGEHIDGVRRRSRALESALAGKCVDIGKFTDALQNPVGRAELHQQSSAPASGVP